MIIDAGLILSNNQAITVSAVSTNSIDLSATGLPYGTTVALSADVGLATEIPMLLNVAQGFNNLTSLAVQLQGSADNATWKEVVTRTYLLAELQSVGQLDFPAQLPVGSRYRYLQMSFTVNGTAPTTGQIFAAIVAARQSNNH